LSSKLGWDEKLFLALMGLIFVFFCSYLLFPILSLALAPAIAVLTVCLCCGLETEKARLR
jgi:hypothetical protein